ncbi:hypothetical protein ABPG72_022306 [Tetrahymena utriculariae]
MQEIENRDNQVIFEFFSKVLDNEEFEQDKSMIRFGLVEDIKILVTFYKVYKQDGKVIQLKVVNDLINKKDKIQSHRTTESLRSRFRYYHSKLDRNRLLNLVDFYFYLLQENERYNRRCNRYSRHYGLIHKSSSILEFDKTKQEFQILFMDINQRQKKYEFKTYTSQQGAELIKKIPVITKKILEQPSEVDWRKEDFKDEQGDSQIESIKDDIENVEESDNEQIGQKVAKKWQLVTPSSSEYSSSEKKKQIETTNKKQFQKQVLKQFQEEQQNIQQPVQLSQNIKKQVFKEGQKEKQKNSQEQLQMNSQSIQERKVNSSNNNENLSFKSVGKQIKSQESSFQNAQMKLPPECFIQQEKNQNYFENMRNSELMGVFNQPPFGINGNQSYYQLIQDPKQQYNLNQFQNYSQSFYFNALESNNQKETSSKLTQNFSREEQPSNLVYRENNLKRKISPQFYNKEEKRISYQSSAYDLGEDSEGALDDLSEESNQELLQLILKKNMLYKMKEHYKEVIISGEIQTDNQKTINYILANQEPCNKLLQDLDQELQLYQQEQNKQEKWDNLIKYLNEQYSLTHEQIICMLDFCNWDIKLIQSYLSDPSFKPQDLIWDSQEDEQLINDQEIKENYLGSKSVEQLSKRKQFLEKINQQLQQKQSQK